MKGWIDLFSPSRERSATTRRFLVLKKGGHPLLYLPENWHMGEATLRLYPAQTFKARALMKVVRMLSPLGIRFVSSVRNIPIDESGAFARFLKELIPGSQGVPTFGVLEGNIKALGRRHALLLFDAAGNPAVVVKVGVAQGARVLIRGEQNFFFPEPPPFTGLPEPLATYDGDDASAIAYRYVEGSSPTLEQSKGAIGHLLSAWIYPGDPIPMTQLPVWADVETLSHESPDLIPVFQSLAKCSIRPVLYHGDFVPWNIRVPSRTGGKWVVLDWERGVRRGMPGWDWFHYVFDYEAMVRRASPHAVVTAIEALWNDRLFQGYAKATGIKSVLKELTLVYLIYSLRFFSPRDHATRIRGILRIFKARFFPDIALSNPKLKISVVTPSYKQLPWLKLCVASVADQKGVAVEHIIQDAQSGADLEAWVRHHAKSRLYVECDTGMYDAINRGLAHATGDIVCWLSSDEQYLEGTLAKVARFFETHPEIDVLFGDALLTNNKGDLLSYRRTLANNVHRLNASHLNAISCSIFVRRSVVDRGFILNTRWRAIANAVWITDLLREGIPTSVVHEPLATFTVTDRNLGRTSLAFTESKRWHEEKSLGRFWMRAYFVILPHLLSIANGLYWLRSQPVSADIYTLGSPEQRVRQTTTETGFHWPK